MSQPMLRAVCCAATFSAIVAIGVPAGAQTNGSVARTPDGKPDLQGNWSFATVTPLERPADLAGKATFTQQEAEEYARRAVERNDSDRRTPGTSGDVALAYNNFWYDRGTSTVGTRQTSLIVDPKDGRLPALTAEGQRAAGKRAEIRGHNTEGPEERSLAERCLLFNAGPPLLPGPYNNNLQIVQTKDYVVIANEMIHDVRIVPLDGRPRLSTQMRNWLGDPRGRWEGDTLVVESTNFSDKTAVRGTDRNLHLIERFRRIDANTLQYEFTIDNPSAFTQPWTVSLPMTRFDEQIYEYACHEANYAMEGMLKAARMADRGDQNRP
jgi:hypothetical protein